MTNLLPLPPLVTFLQATDAEAASLLQELDSLSGDGPNRRSTLPANGTAGEDGEGDEEESDDEDDWEESEEDEESDDEDEVADTWDPSQATPLNGKGRKRRPASAGDAGRRAVLSEADRHVLEHMNAARAEQGQEPLAKLTIAELRQALKGKIIGGQEWVAGKKKKNELVGEYLQMLLDETPGVAEEPRAALEAPPESLKMESPAAASAGAGDQPPGSSNGRKSPFNQLRGAFRRSMRSESSGEVSKTPSRSGSLRSFAARALGQSSRLSSGSAEVSSSAPAPPDGTAYVHSRGSMDDAVAAEDGDTIVVDMQSMVRTSTEEEGKHSGGGGVRPTTSSGSANSGASAKSGAAKRKVWIPG